MCGVPVLTASVDMTIFGIAALHEIRQNLFLTEIPLVPTVRKRDYLSHSVLEPNALVSNLVAYFVVLDVFTVFFKRLTVGLAETFGQAKMEYLWISMADYKKIPAFKISVYILERHAMLQQHGMNIFRMELSNKEFSAQFVVWIITWKICWCDDSNYGWYFLCGRQRV